MFNRVCVTGVLSLLVVLTGCSVSQGPPAQAAYGGGTGQLFDGMGDHTHAITTSSPAAQAYFDQGMIWLYGFNHDEAVRSFTSATELDPGCAMAWWAVSLAQGPNYNFPDMSDDRNTAAWAALQRALAELDDESAKEHALVHALSRRYADPAPADRTHLEQAYAEAMAEVWAAYPDDPELGTLYAYAMMVRTPWKLYDLDYEPAPDTPLIEATLERVMVMDPGNPGACHLYIHAVEASLTPERALYAADRLCGQAPVVGHLNHMPSHIYVQTGHWQRSIDQNAEAMRADKAYLVLSPDHRVGYRSMIHNAHMRAFSAMMVGREQDAILSARAMWAIVPDDLQPEVLPLTDNWMCGLYDVLKRFGRWDDILAEPAPPEYLPLTTAVWRAHRAVAYAAKKDFENAEREYEAFLVAKKHLPRDKWWSRRDLAHRVLEVADYFVQGEIALQQGQWQRAVELLHESAAVEDTLSYGEPPRWLQPVRHTLGAVYLSEGKYEDAERVYREDLAKWPRNGWSLYGLSRALEEQGRTEEALAVKQEYELVWEKADEPTKTSCMCIPST